MPFFDILISVHKKGSDDFQNVNLITEAKDKLQAQWKTEEYINQYFEEEDEFVFEDGLYTFPNLDYFMIIEYIYETTVEDWKTKMYENCKF